jgi:hypothetical protein
MGVVFIHASDATEGYAKLLGRMRPNRVDFPRRAALTAELCALMKVGASIDNIAEKPALMALHVAKGKAQGVAMVPPSKVAIARAVQDLIVHASESVWSPNVDDDYGMAARIYLGVEPGTKGLLLADRRERAAVYSTYKVASARKSRTDTPSHEERLMEAIAERLIVLESDHLDDLATTRYPLRQSNRWSLRPHAAIYRAYESAALLELALVRFVQKPFLDVITTPAEIAFFDTPEVTLPMVGRIFLYCDHVPLGQRVNHHALIERLPARDALGYFAAMLPFEQTEIDYLSRAYALGREHTYDISSAKHEPDDHIKIVEWVCANVFAIEQDQTEPLLTTWSQWLACGCTISSHSRSCRLGIATLSLSRYQRTLEDAWVKLARALSSPPAGFSEWEDGQRIYYHLGLALAT